MTRRLLRECVFKLLFQADFHNEDDFKQQIEQFASFDEDEKISDEDASGIKSRALNIYDKIESIDKLLDEISTGWKVSRMGKADLTILRLAVYEIKYDENVPTSVAINEAVELAKKYGQDASSSFVNGILSKVAD